MRHFLLPVLTVAILACPLTPTPLPEGARGELQQVEKVNFSREILPILTENCLLCHGPDEKARKAKLRLDDEVNVKEGRGVIVPGNSADSELYRRLIAEDEKKVMPQAGSGRKLSAGQIALVKRWIDEGAAWGVHW